MKIFIGLTEVSGYYANLTRGFRELGIDAEHVSVYAHPFRYAEDEAPGFLGRFARFCVARRARSLGGGRAPQVFWLSFVAISRFALFVSAVVRFDVFILGGGSSFFRFVELPLLRLFGKKIVYLFHGTDSRPTYMDGFWEGMARLQAGGCAESSDSSGPAFATSGEAVDACIADAARRKRDVAKIEKYAHVCINYPSFAHFHSKPFVLLHAIGLPHGLTTFSGEPSSHDRKPVRILHSPSHPEGKGTRIIREIIESLIRQGFVIRYAEISGRTNREVLQALEQCDFVVDQVYSDTPMAGFAREAAFHGKPAAVGSYYSGLLRHDLPEQLVPPSLFCHPDQLPDAIRKLVVDEAFRIELGKQARKFVEEHWNAKKVAMQYLRLIENDIPEDWFYHPSRIRYVRGVGFHESRCRKVVRAVIERRGVAALHLRDKPELEQLFVDFAYGRAS